MTTNNAAQLPELAPVLVFGPETDTFAKRLWTAIEPAETLIGDSSTPITKALADISQKRVQIIVVSDGADFNYVGKLLRCDPRLSVCYATSKTIDDVFCESLSLLMGERLFIIQFSDDETAFAESFSVLQKSRAHSAESLAETLGNQCRKLRQAKKWTLEKLAERSGMSVSNLSGFERGRIASTIESVCAISHALGIQPDQYFACLD